MENPIRMVTTKCAVSQSTNKFQFMAEVKKILQRKLYAEKKNINVTIEKNPEKEEYSIAEHIKVTFQKEAADITCFNFSFYDLIFQFSTSEFTPCYEAPSMSGWLKFKNFELSSDLRSKPKEDFSTKISQESHERDSINVKEPSMDEDEMMDLMNQYYLNQIRQEAGMEDYGRHFSEEEKSSSNLSIEEGDFAESPSYFDDQNLKNGLTQNHHFVEDESPNINEDEQFLDFEDYFAMEEEESDDSDFPEEENVFPIEMLEPSTDEGENSFEMRLGNVDETEQYYNFPYALRSERIPTCRAREVVRFINHKEENLRKKYRVRVLKKSKSLRDIQIKEKFVRSGSVELKRHCKNEEEEFAYNYQN